ncbi:MAG: hypothetical protein ACRC53_03450 [Plesiomonas sp.]|uniref:lipid-binding SYLF domain-containing protein n=1 Tax=Plesiomonas sp. TaxID=2486279 RepID=UPI003F404C93
MSVRLKAILCSLLIVFGLVGCGATGDTPKQKRAYIQSIRQDTLNKLYQQQPKTRDLIRNSKGYAVFSTQSNRLALIGLGYGFGVVHDNQSNQDTYMRMMSLSAGLGLGVQDMRVIVIFHDKKTMDNFIRSGWDASANAEMVAKWKDSGAANNQTVPADFKNVTVYELTEHGLALQAMLQGFKYWPDDELN